MRWSSKCLELFTNPRYHARWFLRYNEDHATYFYFLCINKENNLKNTIENYIDATIGIDNPDDDACNSQMQYLSGMVYGYQLALKSQSWLQRTS